MSPQSSTAGKGSGLTGAPARVASEPLYEGADVALLHQAGGAETWVTFGGFGSRDPTAVDYIAARGATGLHVISLADDFFYTAEMEAVLDLIRERRTGRLIVTGVSMGAYGALRFAPALDADQAIAFSPPSTPAPSWDGRWQFAAWGRLGLAPVDLDPPAGAWVLYDPFYYEDRLHVQGLAGVRRVRAPFCDHRVLPALRAAGIAYPALDAMAEGRAPDLRALRDSRRSRALYWMCLGRAARTHRHLALARTALERALTFDGAEADRAGAWWQLGFLLEAAGELPGAIEAVRSTRALAPPSPEIEARLAALHAAAGDLPAAERLLLDALATFPADAAVRRDLVGLTSRAAAS